MTTETTTAREGVVFAHAVADQIEFVRRHL
jgi:hypothetical protein